MYLLARLQAKITPTMRIILTAILITIISNGYCQTDNFSKSLNYTPPFSDVDVAIHQKAINIGENYLILIPWDSVHPHSFRLVATSWFEPTQSSDLNFLETALLLNKGVRRDGSSSSGLDQKIDFESIEHYEEISTCEIFLTLFSRSGNFAQPPFYIPQDLLLAVLINRGIMVGISCFDGEPIVNINDLACKQ